MSQSLDLILYYDGEVQVIHYGRVVLRALSSKPNRLGAAKAKHRAGGLVCVPQVSNETFCSPAECQLSSTELPMFSSVLLFSLHMGIQN